MKPLPMFVVTALLAASSFAGEPQLRERVPQLMREGEVPGVSMVVIRNAKVVWHHAFGVANAETRTPLTEKTIFESASLTKPMFAYAVMRLIEQHVLSLDTPLETYMPGALPDARMKQLTTRMVLTHTTGLQNEVMPGQSLQVHFTPGSRFSYSGAAFLYLQRVVEHVTRKALPLLMRELVFEPLGMHDSSYVWLPSYEKRKAFGHTAAGSVRARRKPEVATIAALHTTPLDYARFVIATMKTPTGKSMIVPQVKVEERCYFCLTGERGPLSETLAWGFGWALERSAFWHWGENNGEFQNFAMGTPNGDGVVIFTNSGNGFSIAPELVSMVLPGEHPAFAWMGYDTYRAPSKQLLRDVLARGASAALAGNASNALNEKQLNAIGYNLLERKRVADAIAVLQRNTQRFPDSFNAYDSLGEAYAAADDRARAIENYRRSLKLNPKNTNATEMIARLSSPRG